MRFSLRTTLIFITLIAACLGAYHQFVYLKWRSTIPVEAFSLAIHVDFGAKAVAELAANRTTFEQYQKESLANAALEENSQPKVRTRSNAEFFASPWGYSKLSQTEFKEKFPKWESLIPKLKPTLENSEIRLIVRANYARVLIKFDDRDAYEWVIGQLKSQDEKRMDVVRALTGAPRDWVDSNELWPLIRPESGKEVSVFQNVVLDKFCQWELKQVKFNQLKKRFGNKQFNELVELIVPRSIKPPGDIEFWNPRPIDIQDGWIEVADCIADRGDRELMQQCLLKTRSFMESPTADEYFQASGNRLIAKHGDDSWLPFIESQFSKTVTEELAYACLRLWDKNSKEEKILRFLESESDFSFFVSERLFSELMLLQSQGEIQQQERAIRCAKRFMTGFQNSESIWAFCIGAWKEDLKPQLRSFLIDETDVAVWYRDAKLREHMELFRGSKDEELLKIANESFGLGGNYTTGTEYLDTVVGLGFEPTLEQLQSTGIRFKDDGQIQELIDLFQSNDLAAGITVNKINAAVKPAYIVPESILFSDQVKQLFREIEVTSWLDDASSEPFSWFSSFSKDKLELENFSHTDDHIAFSWNGRVYTADHPRNNFLNLTYAHSVLHSILERNGMPERFHLFDCKTTFLDEGLLFVFGNHDLINQLVEHELFELGEVDHYFLSW